MGFDVLKNRKRDRVRKVERSRTRSRKRSRERGGVSANAATKTESIKIPDFKFMIPILDELPPDINEELVTYNPTFGFEIVRSFVCRQHIIHDRQTLGYNRITHWYLLKNL